MTTKARYTGTPTHPRALGKKAPQSYACPTFFKALVYEARAGERSFADCGYELGRNLIPLVGEDLGEEVLGELVVLLSKRDHAAILRWLTNHVPKMMGLIPSPQYGAFLKGFLKAFEDGSVQIDAPLAA